MANERHCRRDADAEADTEADAGAGGAAGPPVQTRKHHKDPFRCFALWFPRVRVRVPDKKDETWEREKTVPITKVVAHFLYVQLLKQ